MKKLVSLILAAALMVSAAACGNSGTGSKDSAAKEGSGSAAASGEAGDIEVTETNRFGWEVPKETIKFSYYVGDDTVDMDESVKNMQPVTDLFKDEFNLEIEMIAYKQSPEERLNLMLASDDYPDVLCNIPDRMAEQFISQDRALELTPYLEKYGQNLLDGIGDYLNLLKTQEGSLYKLPYAWGNTTDIMGRDFSIRHDMLEAAGLPVYDSFESYYQTVKTLVEKNPTNEAGAKTYGFTAFSEKGEEFYKTPLAFMGFNNVESGVYKYDEETNEITHWVDTEEGLAVAKFINQFWRDGLIDPDFQTKDYDTALAFMADDRVVGNIGTWWHSYVGGHEFWLGNDPDWTIDKRMDCVTFQEGDLAPKTIANNYLRLTRNIITDKCTNPEGVMKYFNWEETPVGVAVVSMGAPGADRAWDFDEKGEIKVNDWYWYGKEGDSTFVWNDFEEKQGGGYTISAPGYTPLNRTDDPGTGWASPVAAVNLWDLIPDYEELDESKLSAGQTIMKGHSQLSHPYLWDSTVWSVTFGTDDPVTDIYLSIKDAIAADWARVITASSEEECVELFEAMKENLHNLGLEDLVRFQQDALSSNVEKMES